MKDSTIVSYVNVFISSCCGGRYTIVRKSLKALLEETNMAKVYIFEDALASSQDVVPSYLNKLEQSDLCVFLIDNKDNVSEAVLKEIKRARKLKKKSIFVFCDQDDKNPTAIQIEITNNLRERYVVVHEFSDFTHTSYKAILNDIIDIYRVYCYGNLLEKSDQDINVVETKSAIKESSVDDDDSNLKISTESSYILKKDIFKGFDKTNAELLGIIKPQIKNPINTTIFDDVCVFLFRFITGKSRLPANFIETYKTEIANKHSGDMLKLMHLRIDVLDAYIKGQTKSCHKKIILAYDFAKDSNDIPNWVCNDLLIDMRNIEFMILETKNKNQFDNEAQLLLNANSESVYYPIVDRSDKHYLESSLDLLIRNIYKNPFSTQCGGAESILKSISSTFISSTVYCSLTQMLMIRNRIGKALSVICKIDYIHSAYVELVTQFLLTEDKKSLDNIKILFPKYQSTDEINDNDLEMILNAIRLIPVKHNQLKAILLFFKHFGDYLSDVVFLKLYAEIHDEFLKWIFKKTLIKYLYSFFIDAIKKNSIRFDPNTVVVLITTIVSMKQYDYYDGIFEMISSLSFKKMSDSNQKILLDIILRIIEDEDRHKIYRKLNSTIIYLKKALYVNTNEIDERVKTHMPDFFDNIYSLEILTKLNENESWRYISEFTNSIKKQYEERGEQGCYKGFLNNTYKTIRNIIEYNELKLNWQKCKPIVEAIKLALLSDNNLYSEKYDAIQLLMFLYHENYSNEMAELCEEMFVKNKKVLSAHGMEILDKACEQTLKNAYLILGCCLTEVR